MGKEARVFAEIDDWYGEGKLLLETDELYFRGARRLTIPLSTIRDMRDEKGWLVVAHEGGEARFDLGASYTEKWMHAIRNPKQLIDKLDVKPSSAVYVEGDVDALFIESIDARTKGRVPGTDPASLTDLDLIFIAINEPGRLKRITELRNSIKSTGAIWVLHPRGRRELSHEAILDVAKPVGLIDVKSARFDDSYAGLKLMVPRAQR